MKSRFSDEGGTACGLTVESRYRGDRRAAVCGRPNSVTALLSTNTFVCWLMENVCQILSRAVT